MFSRLSRLIVFFAALQILGGHWAALQTVAWAGMLAKYARGETLVVAIEKTFDGDHPCGLCKVVKTGRDEEQKQQVAKVVVKLDAILGSVLETPIPPSADWTYFSRVLGIEARWSVPPTPPPQSA